MIEEIFIEALPLLVKLVEYVATEFKHVRNAETNFEILVNTLAKAQPLLGYFRLSLFLLMDPEFQQTCDTFADLCYHTEDLINEVRESKNRNPNSKWSKILKSFQPHKINNHIQSIQETLKELTCQFEKIRNILSSEESHRNRDSTSDLIGRENEVKEIKRDLISGQIKRDLISGQSANGISIIGRRGLGKTALARFISHDPDINEKFSTVKWIDVKGGNFMMENEKNKLASVLADRESQTLIIFDNLLFISSQDWLELWQSMFEGRDNIKILITTSNPEVSQETLTKSCFLDSLPDPECKELIIKIATSQNKSLTESSMKIPVVDMLVTKCEGLPLLALTIGSTLAKLERLEWDDFSKKDIWEWKIFQKEIFPLLKGSYKDMPPRLMECFYYFSLFPCNHNFHNIDDLFQLWESEGFLTQREDESTFRNTAKEKLQWLRDRSLVQCDKSGEVYKLQRLSQKIAEVASSKTCLRFDSEGPTSLPESTRHLSFLRENLKILRDSEDRKVKHLRTILSINDRRPTGVTLEIPPKIFQKKSLLRVLSLSGINIESLPSVKSLKHLRYLNVSRTPIRSLPEKLAELSNLLFLMLSNTPHLLILPNSFDKLTNLQCIGWDIGEIRRFSLIQKIGCLTKLQTLPLFCVGNDEGFRIPELEKMNSLQNSICVENLENVQSKKEAEQAKLHEKRLLTELELQWSKPQNIEVAAKVLTALKPHEELSKLKITNYSGLKFPEWISNSKFWLKKLHLYECGCNSLPALGQLMELKTLILQGMKFITKVDKNFCGPRQNTAAAGYFPSLESLRFEDMENLQGWTGLESNDMPHLHVLQIESCPKMTEFPSHAFSSLQDLIIIRCKELDTLPNLANLSSTRTLYIRESDKLEEKCSTLDGDVLNTLNRFDSVKIELKATPTTSHGLGNILQHTDEGLKEVFQDYQAEGIIETSPVTSGLPLTSEHDLCDEMVEMTMENGEEAMEDMECCLTTTKTAVGKTSLCLDKPIEDLHINVSEGAGNQRGHHLSSAESTISLSKFSIFNKVASTTSAYKRKIEDAIDPTKSKKKTTKY